MATNLDFQNLLILLSGHKARGIRISQPFPLHQETLPLHQGHVDRVDHDPPSVLVVLWNQVVLIIQETQENRKFLAVLYALGSRVTRLVPVVHECDRQ